MNTVIVLWVHPVSALVIPKSQFGWMGVNILVGAVSSLLIAKSIQAHSAAYSSMIEIAYPFFVILFGILFFKADLPSIKSLLGGALVFAGILLILKDQ